MKTLRAWIPAILWMGVIFFFSTRERVQVSPQETINFIFFKTLHVIEYAVLYILYWRASRNMRTAFILTIVYAATDEIHQLFTPTRQGALRDVIIDAVGASLSWYFLSHLLPKAPKRLREWGRRLGIH